MRCCSYTSSKYLEMNFELFSLLDQLRKDEQNYQILNDHTVLVSDCIAELACTTNVNLPISRKYRVFV